MAKKEKIEKPPFVEAIEYENFVDAFYDSYKKGMFVLAFGQGIETPPKVVVRLWIDPVAFKLLIRGLQEDLAAYEKKFGKIE